MYIIVPLQKANCKKRLNTKVDATSKPALQSTGTSALFVCRGFKAGQQRDSFF